MQIKEKSVPNLSQVYRLVKVSDDGTETPTQRFRVRKRIKLNGRWTTRPKTFESFEAAKRYAKYGEAEPAPSNFGNVFREVFERFLVHKRLKERLSSGSLDGYRNRARHLKFLEEMNMSQITPKAIDAWLGLLFDPEYLVLQQKSRVSYEHEYFLLSGIFTYFRNHEDENFRTPLLARHREMACRRARSSKAADIRYLTPSEEEEFLVNIRIPIIRDLAVIQLHTGARVGEVAALEFFNVDFKRNEVRFVQHLDWERKQGGGINVLPGTKGGPPRTVLLTRECREVLVRRHGVATSSVAFPGAEGRWLTYRSIQSAYDRAFRAAHLPHRGTHTLRHTFAVRFLDETKDVHALQRLLGHSDLKDTLRYAKYTTEAVRRSFQLFRGGLAGENEGDVPQLVPQH